MTRRTKQLAFAREFLGYTQTDLSKKIIGLSQSNLSRFEKGVDSLSDELFNRIVEFLGFPIEFYDLSVGNDIENKQYRKRSAISKKEVIQLEGSVKFIGYLIDQMSAAVEFPDFSITPLNVEEGYSPENAALHTRNSLGLKAGEPVRDIYKLLEESGIIIVEFDAIDKFDAISIFSDLKFPFIVINKNLPSDRKRFTLAHELGHLVMHIAGCFPIPDYRTNDLEIEANRFASEFLMPERAIKNMLGGLKLRDLLPLKEQWLTSMSSIIRRAYDLKMISDKKYKFLSIEMSRAGYRKKEPGIVYIDKPNLYRSAYMLHKQELNYSDEDLSKAFNLPISIISKFFDFNVKPRLKIRL